MEQETHEKIYVTIIFGLVIVVSVMVFNMMRFSDLALDECRVMAQYSAEANASCYACRFMYNVSDRCEMYNQSIKAAFVDGLYFSDGYYCVWTKGQSLAQITNTESHEQCHALIINNSKHFCGVQND